MSPPRHGNRGPGRPSAHRPGRSSSGTWGDGGGLAGCCLVSLGFLAMAASGVLILLDPSSPPLPAPFSAATGGGKQSEATGMYASGTPTASEAVTAPSVSTTVGGIDGDRGIAGATNAGNGRGGGGVLRSSAGAQVFPRRSLQGRIQAAAMAGGSKSRSTLAQDERVWQAGVLMGGGRGRLGGLGGGGLQGRSGGGTRSAREGRIESGPGSLGASSGGCYAGAISSTPLPWQPISRC